MASAVALFAALGFGSIAAALVARWIAISNHRQNWINNLRDDIATFLMEIDRMKIAVVRSDVGHTKEAALLVYRRILLRLNITEAPHIELAVKLKNLLAVGPAMPSSEEIDDAVALSRKILKQEWAVTKYGVFTKLVLWWKGST